MGDNVATDVKEVEIHGVNWIEMLHVGLTKALHEFRDGCLGCLEEGTLEEGIRSLIRKTGKTWSNCSIRSTS